MPHVSHEIFKVHPIPSFAYGNSSATVIFITSIAGILTSLFHCLPDPIQMRTVSLTMFIKRFAHFFFSQTTTTLCHSDEQIALIDDAHLTADATTFPPTVVALATSKFQDGESFEYLAGEFFESVSAGSIVAFSHDVAPIRYRLGAAGDWNHQRSRSLYNNPEKLKNNKRGADHVRADDAPVCPLSGVGASTCG
jgi:hypothetical protein